MTSPALCLPDPEPRPTPAPLSERDAALAAIIAHCRAYSAATTGKAPREALADRERKHVIALEGSLARLDAAEGRLPAHRRAG